MDLKNLLGQIQPDGGNLLHGTAPFHVVVATTALWHIDPVIAGPFRTINQGIRASDNQNSPEQFPYTCKTGWVYDSGDYATTLRRAMDVAGYHKLRREQAAKRARGELMGIGISFFTEAVGAGPRNHMDMVGLGMNDGAALRISPTGKAQLGISVQTQGQGHETTFAQIVAEELGIPPEDVDVIHGDTDTTPYGLGTYGSRSTPVSGAATAIVARKVRDKARLVASAMLEVSPGDLEWEKGRWFVTGDPEQGATI